MRVIIRFSIDGDDGTVGNLMQKMMEESGFVRIGTAAWEHLDLPEPMFVDFMTRFWSAVNNPRSIIDGSRGRRRTRALSLRFDHVWVYCDLGS